MRSVHDTTADVTQLGDQELIEALQRVLAQERGVHARLLVHLAEVDARGLYRDRAFSSMFDYCVRALHMSEAEAYLRIRVARLSREFPCVLAMLQTGELHLSALKLLAPLLDQQNAQGLLEAARFKSKREVELLLAARSEKPDVPSLIRRLPQATPACAPASMLPLEATVQSPNPAAPCTPSVEPEPAPRFDPRPSAKTSNKSSLEPLGPARYKLQLTASQQLHDKLQQARDLMRHELHDADLAHVVERAHDLLIADRMKRRFGVGRKARVTRSQKQRKPVQPDTRHIPHAVRREVLARDGARCTFVSADGLRCGERAQLELHHEQPFGRGGPATVSNIRVLCRSHNRLLAERDYGRSFIQQRIKRAREPLQLVPGRGTVSP